MAFWKYASTILLLCTPKVRSMMKTTPFRRFLGHACVASHVASEPPPPNHTALESRSLPMQKKNKQHENLHKYIYKVNGE